MRFRSWRPDKYLPILITSNHHNVFERHHRFIGWLGLAVRGALVEFRERGLILEPQATWVFVILGDTYDINTRTWRTDGNQLISSQEFWFALAMTVLCVHQSSCYFWASDMIL